MLSIFKKEQPPYVNLTNINDLIREGNDFYSDELILLDEKLTGNLYCAEKVVVEHNGILSGNINSKNCMIAGTINGDIASVESLDIKSSAVIKGNIKSAVINIEPGAVINGHITVGNDTGADLSKTHKFSTDDYLTAKLARELTELNKADSSAHIVVKKEVKPEPVALREVLAAKPLTAATPASVKDVAATVSAPVKEVIAAAPATVTPEPVIEKETIKAPAPLAAAAPPKAKQEENTNQRWW